MTLKFELPANGDAQIAAAESGKQAPMTEPAITRKVAIILVNWNGWRDAIECLSSIYGGLAFCDADVWLVDNASSDGSIERIAAWCQQPLAGANWHTFDGVLHHVAPFACRILQATGQMAPAAPEGCLTIVQAGGNLGFAGGNNVGMAAAGLQRYTHFWLLNTDTVIRHDALDKLMARAAEDPGLGTVGSTLIYYRQPQQVQALGGAQLDEQGLRANHIGDGYSLASVPKGIAERAAVEAKMAYVVGASMLVSSEFVRHVGFMCEDYFLYFEELDWAFRARSRYRLGYAPQSLVFHKVGGSSSQPVSEFSLNLLYRNQLRFTARFMPERLGQVQRKLFWEVLRQVAKGHWTAVRLLLRALRDRHTLAAAGAKLGAPKK